MKLDPEVKSISKEGLSLLTFATEQFLSYASLSSFSISTIQNRRKLLPRDLMDATGNRAMLSFLGEDIRQQVGRIERDAKDGKEKERREREEKKAKKVGQVGGGIGEFFGGA